MNIEAALKLKTATDLRRAAQEAEARNCSLTVINTLWARYYEAVDREQRAGAKETLGGRRTA